MIRLTRHGRSRPEIGMAPLVDCIFLLLVFFLLASRFSRDAGKVASGIEIELPAARTGHEPSDERIAVTLTESGELTLDGRAVTLERLGPSLRALVEDGGPRPLLLVADRRVRLEILARVIDRAREAGLPAVSIATRELEEAAR